MASNTIPIDKLELAVPVGAAVLLGALIIPWLSQEKAALTKYPLIGAEVGGSQKRRKYFFEHAKELHHDGYQKYRNLGFRVTEASGDLLILPIRYLDELRKMPDEVVNHVASIDEFLQKEFLGFSVNNPIVNHIVRADLTKNLPKLNPPLWMEVKKTVPDFLGISPEWKAFGVTTVLLPMVAIVSGHAFIGPEHCRDEAYLDASINYTVDLFNTAAELRQWPKMLRPLVKNFFPGVKKVWNHRRRAYELLFPIIQKRRRLAAAGEPVPDDVLQWMISKADKFDVKDDKELAEAQLMLSLAAIHTTTMMATHIFYDLAAVCPEVIPDLRKEIREALNENDGVLTAQAVQQMKLLDSTMRESQRTNAAAMSMFIRTVLKDVTLSDGTVIPANTPIAVPHLEAGLDPSYYPDPEKFNPYRFADIRNSKVKDPLKYSYKEQYQFVSVTKENTSFGFGRHSCPGRFFASNEIKLFLAHIILNYDIKMPDGVAERYHNIFQGASVIPDPTKELMFRYIGDQN